MSKALDKQVPSHPFTMADVEVMRTMRLRLTHRKFRIAIALQALLALLVVFWVVYVIASCSISGCLHLRWMNEWIVLISLLFAIVSIVGIVATVRRYRSTLRFLSDPATHPDVILNGGSTSSDTLATARSPQKNMP
ncbi:hypothetical protein GGF46_002314 [Coemansia sp. RSA 552]|nr:hypothetical protein GGF46_002314 [Coemansia sp. RSA 552]